MKLKLKLFEIEESTIISKGICNVWYQNTYVSEINCSILRRLKISYYQTLFAPEL